MQPQNSLAIENLWQGQDYLEVLTFELNGEIFALEAALVREILDLVPTTAVPGAPTFVERIVNFRGRVIPLADIRLPFEMETREPTIDSRIVVISLVLREEEVLVGLLTDRVHEVTNLSRAASEPPPSVGMRWRPDYLHCLVKRDGEFIIVPNLQAIFASNDTRG